MRQSTGLKNVAKSPILQSVMCDPTFASTRSCPPCTIPIYKCFSYLNVSARATFRNLAIKCQFHGFSMRFLLNQILFGPRKAIRHIQ